MSDLETRFRTLANAAAGFRVRILAEELRQFVEEVRSLWEDEARLRDLAEAFVAWVDAPGEPHETAPARLGPHVRGSHRRVYGGAMTDTRARKQRLIAAESKADRLKEENARLREVVEAVRDTATGYGSGDALTDLDTISARVDRALAMKPQIFVGGEVAVDLDERAALMEVERAARAVAGWLPNYTRADTGRLLHEALTALDKVRANKEG